ARCAATRPPVFVRSGASSPGTAAAFRPNAERSLRRPEGRRGGAADAPLPRPRAPPACRRSADGRPPAPGRLPCDLDARAVELVLERGPPLPLALAQARQRVPYIIRRLREH